MSKNKQRVNERFAKSRRAIAIARNTFRYPSEERCAPQSPMSFPIKREQPELRKLIDEALARRSAS